MSTIKKGRLGYNIVERELLKRDWDIYVPILEDTKIDCIAIKKGKLLRIQIKTIVKDRGKKHLPVKKVSHNQGSYKIHLYTKDEIDFFFGVDVETEDIYVVPVSFSSKYTSAISETSLKPYKNNFNLMEPSSGNTISEEDDIGEGLTANTEGIA